MEYSNRRRSRSRSNSKSRKNLRRSRSRRSSQSRSRSRSLSRISGRGSHSKMTKNKSRLSRSRSRSFSRQKRSRSSRSSSISKVRKFRSRSRSKSRSYKSRLSRSRSRSISRHKKSRSRSKSRYKKSISRSRSKSKSRCQKHKLSRSRSHSRPRKSRSKSVSKTKYKKSRSARSRSTSRKRKTKSSRSRSRSTHRKGLKEQPKRRSKLRSASPSRRYDNEEMPSVIKKETEKRKKVSNIKECDNKYDNDDDDLLEIPVEPPTPPPMVDLASESDEEEQKNKKQVGSQESPFNKEDMRIPLNFFDKKSTLSNVPENISSLKFNEVDPMRALSKVDSSNDLLMPLTFGRKQPQTIVPSVQHQTVDLTENTDMRPSDMRLSNMRPSVYDMEDEISVGETTIDLNLGKTPFLDSVFREKNRGKLTTDSEFEGIIGSNSESSLLKNTTNLTPLKSNLDNTEVVLDEAPVTKDINVTEDVNHIVKKRTTGQCAAAYLREGEILSTLRILHEMGREMGIWQNPISALYNQLSQLQTEGGDPRKYLNQNKDASDTLNLIKGHLESVLEDSKLGAIQRVVRGELLHLISDIINGKSSHVPVECLTCYGIRIDVLACSMLHEDPEEIKEFIHNTLIYEGIYEPTYENISTIFKKVENFQKRFHHGERNIVEHSKESFHHGESVTVEN